MKLSVVIVNYNVKYFLEQCLRSVSAAADGLDGALARGAGWLPRALPAAHLLLIPEVQAAGGALPVPG